MKTIKRFRIIAMLGVLAAAWASTSATFTDDAESSASFTTGSVEHRAGRRRRRHARVHRAHESVAIRHVQVEDDQTSRT